MLAKSTRSQAAFSELLGLDPDGVHRVSSVAQRGTRIEIVVESGTGEEPATFFIEHARDDAPAFAKTEELALSYRGKQIHAELGRLVRAGLSRARCSWQELLELLSEQTAVEPEVESGFEQRSDTLAQKIRARLDAAGGPMPDPWGYADFIGRYDLYCQKVISLWLFNPCSLILHGDSECFGPPNMGLGMVMTINAPWDNRQRDKGRPRGSVRRVTEPSTAAMPPFVTDIREHDVIAGSPALERRVVEHVFASDPGPVIFFHACAGVVAGTGMEQLVASYKRTHHLPVLYFRGGENQALRDFFKEILVDARKLTPRAAGTASSSLNLVGYAAIATETLVQSLEALGIRVNSTLLPGVDVPGVTAFENASVNVFLPNVDFESFYAQLRESSAVPRQLEPAAPYGIDGTRRWLRALAEACEIGGADARIESLAAPFAERWERLRARVADTKLLLVARDFEIDQLLDARFNYGVPLLETLREMGFALEVLVGSTDPLVTDWARERLSRAGEGAPGTFSDRDGMQRLLAESRAAAIYSNLFFDWRASGAGKATFSLQHFEPGFDGALRTLERLLGVCQTPYFRRYGRYLRRGEA
jgi:hypothetical protein